MSAGSTYNVNATDTIGRLSGDGSIVIASGQTLLTVIGNGTTRTFSGVISGAGSFSKSGAGELILDDNQTYTGATTIHQGS